MGLIKTSASVRTDEELFWDKLVEEIWAGNVIPVIGDSFVVDGTTVTKEIIDHMADKYDVKDAEGKKPGSYSELYYHKNYETRQSGLYEEVTSLIKDNQENFKPTDVLQKFLSIEQFPFVITTSVDYTVEETMKEVWSARGRDVKTLVFTGKDPEKCDVKSDADMKNPTVFYMFGKANSIREHSFALTDEDMLSFCKSWLSEDKHPNLLSRIMAGKYLLFLGVNYPDWLIRFVWYSMRSNLKDSGVYVGSHKLDGKLQNFFSQVNIRTKDAPLSVYDEIKTRLDRKNAEEELQRFQTVAENTDFFISYSRRDSEWADALYTKLKVMGYSVWYDKNSICCGEEWDTAIRRGIRTSRCFIALLSDNMATESDEYHPYTVEWDIALSRRVQIPDFVKPVCIGDADIYKNPALKLPQELTTLNACAWRDIDEITDVVNAITK